MQKSKVKDPCAYLDEKWVGLWVNLYVMKDGAAHAGTRVHDTEDIAKTSADRSIEDAKRLAKEFPNMEVMMKQSKKPWADLSYVMQIPWNK